MNLVTADESRRIDQMTQMKYGIHSRDLMQNAAEKCVEKIFQLSKFNKSSKVTILCGPGNNGGDGLVIAKILNNQNKNVQVIIDEENIKEESLCGYQLETVKKLNINIVSLKTWIRSKLEEEFIIDALFGTGGDRDLSGEYLKVVKKVNKIKAPVLAVDCPSGLEATKGTLLGKAVKANWTVTFGWAKTGFYLNYGPDVCGKISVVDIGFPKKLYKEVAGNNFLLERRIIKKWLPVRSNQTNKSTFGHSLILAGSEEYFGAALLTSTAAYRVGSGYVTLASWNSPIEILEKTPEVIITQIEKINSFEKYNSIVIGPGLGTEKKTFNLLKRIYLEFRGPVVVDADALTVLEKNKFRKLRPNWILTPHAGELSRMIGATASEIESDRLCYSRQLSESLNCLTLLKGFKSVLSFKCKSIINPTGNSALAKAGSGDTLAGMIGGFLSRGMSPVRAACAGMFIHGFIADKWIKEGNSKNSMMSSDISERIPNTLYELEKH